MGRFTVSPLTLWIDRAMAVVITFGGAGIIVSVFGIFLFIFLQIFPLFGRARVEEKQVVETGLAGAVLVGIDEWGELPFVYDGGRQLRFLRVDGGPAEVADLPLAEGDTVTTWQYKQGPQQLTLGTASGRVLPVMVRYATVFSADGSRRVTGAIEGRDAYAVGREGVAVSRVAYGQADTRRLVVVAQEFGEQAELHALTLRQRRSLVGAGRIEPDRRQDLTPLLEGARPVHLLVGAQSDSVIVADPEGRVTYLVLGRDGFEVRQRFTPFEDLPQRAISRMDFIFGDVSVSFVGVGGEHRVFSLFRGAADGGRQFGWTKEFPALPGPGTAFGASLRNKAFAVASGNRVSLRFLTTESVRWERDVGFAPRQVLLDAKYERMGLLEEGGRLHLLEIDDPHPEAGWRAFFGKVWYEGADAPAFTWQSTGGTDDFEPKLSLVPLIFGSVKGTFYALLFAVPLAFAAAFYTSQFLDARLRGVVKPTMEIMASLPSVVLGFLAALWLAPILADRVPSALLVVVGTPLLLAGCAWGWLRLPAGVRTRLPAGWEFAAAIPLALLGAWGFWEAGPWLERMLFVVVDPQTGVRTADFRLWWPEATGLSFDQRNSLVVGFIMGFAVIPIIFTISEDALSNVPSSLIAGSLALGASRWQTARQIVLPTALAGVFSATMIGFGRAVGETMIVVMATGNTPIMEWNVFSGMRTLSANIAVELPEAPQFSTHYRTLYLGAMVLFILTFALNSVAEVLRQRLRERFKTA